MPERQTDLQSVQDMLSRIHEVGAAPAPGMQINETAGFGFDGEIEIQAAPPYEETRATFAFRRSDNGAGFSYQVTPHGPGADSAGGTFSGFVPGSVVSTAREAFHVLERADSRFADWGIAGQPMGEAASPAALLEAKDSAKLDQARLALLENPANIIDVLSQVKHFAAGAISEAEFAHRNKRVYNMEEKIEESKSDFLDFGKTLAYHCREFLEIWDKGK